MTTTDVMTQATIRSLRRKLLAARRAAVDGVEHSTRELDAAAEVAEAEVEERSQEEAAASVASGFAERGFASLRQIEGALARMANGTYGVCVRCGERVPVVRLRVLPSTPYCTRCAAQAALGAGGAGAAAASATMPPSPPIAVEPTGRAPLSRLSPALEGATDAELAAVVRECFAEEVGEALGTFRVLCRHGVITLDGEIANEELRATAFRIVEEELGLETVDRLWITPFAREAFLPDRDGREAEASSAPSGRGADMYEILQDDVVDYTPPDRPPPQRA